jgi:hypothetical protein
MISLADRLRAILRRNRSWVAFRQLQLEGWVHVWRRRKLWRCILDTPPVATDPAGPPVRVEVHLLCSYRDYLCAIWTLKSFYHFAGVSYPLVIHIQGAASPAVYRHLQTHFPQARVVLQSEANSIVEEFLSRHHLRRLAEARRVSPFMLKLIDFPVLSNADYLVTLDSDVLFFARPAELLEAAASPVHSRFQRDAASAYNITEAQAASELGIRMAPAINTGITLFPRRNLDLERCERYLAHPEVAQNTTWIEQTLHALCASEQGLVEYLPASYLLSFEPALSLDALVARHYAGPTRLLMTDEGMPAILYSLRGAGNGR